MAQDVYQLYQNANVALTWIHLSLYIFVGTHTSTMPIGPHIPNIAHFEVYGVIWWYMNVYESVYKVYGGHDGI